MSETPVLKDKTVTNSTSQIQTYQDYLYNTIRVAPGETKTFQVIDEYTDSGAGLPDDNIPSDSRYVKIANANGEFGYIKPNLARNGVLCQATEPPAL